ncbi:hypothetical protein KX816_04515 [Sphingosinicellaceae bacterium]|nr:hypothetical protein KX816_04515 [Sphingosinicellaceae bacterium]
MAFRDPDEPFSLDFADLELLMALLRSPHGKPAAMRPRLREFQKRFFPKVANTGRGRRATYTLREALHVAVAFELVDMDLSSPRCINVVEQNRRRLDPLFVAAWATVRGLEEGRLDEEALSRRRARLTFHVALSATTHGGGVYSAFGGPPEDPWPADWPGRRSRISIDMVALVADVLAALEGESFRFLRREVDGEFLALGHEMFGPKPVEEWQPGRIDPYDDRYVLQS